jgi:predicted alpha/beta-fold hydrolase
MIFNTSYTPPSPFRFGHLSTIFPALFRQVECTFARERLTLEDGDFVDLDWSKVGSTRLVLLLHGLEGSSDSRYIKGMAKAFNQKGWDAVAVNFRGCSGEINRKVTGYHMGATADVREIIQYVLRQNPYVRLVPIGFSLGGNVLLKYLGEQKEQINSKISHALAFSVPVDIPNANIELAKWYNRIYIKRFLRSLNGKLVAKMKIYPGEINWQNKRLPNSFQEFDGCYTAPIHGFGTADNYWEVNSSKHFIDDIRVPTLLVNAKDDSFLGDSCYPYSTAKNHDYFHLMTPRYGGHVGFIEFNEEGLYWSEKQALQFVKS